MHVLVIPSWYPHPDQPTAGIFFKEQAEALQQSGLRVGVVAPIRRSIRTLMPPATGPRKGVLHVVPTLTREYFAVPRLQSVNDRRGLAIGSKLFEEYTKVNGVPDILHAHGALNGGWLARCLSDRTGIPYLVTEHSSAFGRELLSAKELSVAETVYRGAKALVAVSPSLVRDLERRLPSTLGRWNCVPNSVDAGFFNAGNSVRGVDRKFTYLAIAGFNKNKNIESLVLAFAKLKELHSLQLNIGGGGAGAVALGNLVRKLGLSASVRFMGWLGREEIRAAISDADVFVVPSRYETFAVVLVEALAMGKPVIATACGGPEAIVDDLNGKLVPVDDVAALVRAMYEIRKSYGQYDSQGIRQRCLSRFSTEAVVARVRAIYSTVSVRLGTRQ